MENKHQLFIILSMVIWGSIGIFRRFIPINSELLAFTRGVIGTLFLLGYAKASGKNVFQPMGKKELCLLVLSGGIMGANWILLFEAYKVTSVSTATLCYYMQPTILILLSPLFFKETLTGKKLLYAGLALVGMVLVSGILDTGIRDVSEISGILYALGAALLYAFVVILNKKLPDIDGYQRTVIQIGSSAVVLFPYLLIKHCFQIAELNGISFLFILLVGVVHTGIAYALYFGSVNHVRAQSVAILSYADPISALLLSALILGERMSFWSILGTVLILGSAYLAERHS